MKGQIKKFLKNRDWFYPLRYSFFFSVYQRIFRPRVIAAAKKEIQFYNSFLSPCNLVFDIGANDGHKTVAFLTFSKQVICCEPDADNFALLKSRFRNQKKRVSMENKAVSDHPGRGKFYLHHQGSAFNTLSRKWQQLLEADDGHKWNERIQFSGEAPEVQLITLDWLIDKYGLPDFIKIDVEGYEEWVIRGLTREVRSLSFEALLPDCRAELLTCLRLLAELSTSYEYNVAVDEELLFEKFLPQAELIRWLDKTSIYHFEIIVRLQSR